MTDVACRVGVVLKLLQSPAGHQVAGPQPVGAERQQQKTEQQREAADQ